MNNGNQFTGNNSSGYKPLSMEAAIRLKRQFDELADSMRQISKAQDDFTHLVVNILRRNLEMECDHSLKMEAQYALKYDRALFFTKWYYRGRYRKYRYRRICLERLIRNIQ